MRRDAYLRIALLLLLTVIGGAAGCCARTPTPPADGTALLPGFDEERALEERLRRMVIPFDGYAPLDPDGEWQVGDELLYGVEHDDDGDRSTWILGFKVATTPLDSGEGFPVELTDETGRQWSFTSPVLLAAASTYDPTGTQVESSVSMVPESYLRHGIVDACLPHLDSETTRTPIAELSDDEAESVGRDLARAFASMIAIFTTLQQNETLEKILWKVVDKPSVFSVVFSGGVRVSIAPRFEESEIEERPLAGIPPGSTAVRVPLDISVNDKVALRTVLSVVESRFPLCIGAGLIAIDGEHPRDPGRRVSVRLLASRRGWVTAGEEDAESDDSSPPDTTGFRDPDQP